MSDRIKKLLMTIAALGALAAGGSALANAAQGDASSDAPAAARSDTAGTPEPGDKPDANEPGESEDGDQQDTNEASDQVSDRDAKTATRAALAATDGGTVNEVSAEHQDDNQDNGGPDTPEPGDTPDPAYESQIAFDVEVAKTDGTVVDVHLDKAFSVLGTTATDAEDGD